MECGAIWNWTLPSLVGAYLDLALAYLFLTAATLAFLASKFLALFGLALPCSCITCGGDSDRVHSSLAEYPVRKISGVHLAVRESFPFDSSCHCRSCGCYCCAKFGDVKDAKFMAATRELPVMGKGEGGEESSGSVSNADFRSDIAECRDSFGRAQMDSVKGKDFVPAGTPPFVLYGLRKWRNILSMSGKSPPASLTRTPTLTPPSGCEEVVADGTQFTSEIQHRASEDIHSAGFSASGDRVSGNQINSAERVASEGNWYQNRASCGSKQVCESKQKDSAIIRDLRRALVEERSAHAALCLELEKERSAAATAAAEAMAMILRLQGEKASIEMEARQFERMVEEKSAYVEEEMEILKEIILRREMENHVLEKEIEAFRSMMFGGSDAQHPMENRLIEAVQSVGDNAAKHSSYDSEEVLKAIYKSIVKEKVKDRKKCIDDVGYLDDKKQNSLSTLDDDPLSHCLVEDGGYSLYNNFKKGNHNMEFHSNLFIEDECNMQEEKSIMTTKGSPSSLQHERPNFGKNYIFDKQGRSGIDDLISYSNDEEDGRRTGKHKAEVPLSDIFMRQNQNTVKTGIESTQFVTDPSVLGVRSIDNKTILVGKGIEEPGKDCSLGLFKECIIESTQFVIDPSVLGVRSVDNNTVLVGKGIEEPAKDCSFGLFKECIIKNEQSTNTVGLSPPVSDARCRSIELNIHRSYSDITKAVHSNDGSCRRASSLGLRRSSMSAADNGKFKFENEVEILNKRLKLIQLGSGKLSLSILKTDKESHSQLFEEIALQLQENQKGNGTWASTCQSSLPCSSQLNQMTRRHSLPVVPPPYST